MKATSSSTRLAILALAAGLLGAADPARAQEAERGELSVRRIFGTPELLPERFDGAWKGDPEGWYAVEEDDAGRDEIWRVEAETGERVRWVPAGDLVPEGRSEPLAIADFSFSPDRGKLLLFTDVEAVWRYSRRGTYWVLDLSSRRLRPLSEAPGAQMLAKWGPDGERVAFVRDGRIFLARPSTGEERLLVGSERDEVLTGTMDWVYEEEFGIWDGYRWSPDGERIAFWRFDRGPVGTFYLLDETALYPELRPVRYPKAGTDNSLVRLGVAEVATGEVTWFDPRPGQEGYLPRMEWVADGEIVIQRLNRHQNRLELLRADPETGETSPFFAETDSAWVDVVDDLVWIEGGERFLWTSERDGRRHVYLYRGDGTLVRRLTEGPWEVTDLLGVDEEEGQVYFQASRRSPLTRSVGRVGLDGSGPRWLVGPALAGEGGGPGGGRDLSARGWHSAEFSPDFRWFFHTRSATGVPPVTSLRRSDGREVRTLVENAELGARLDSLDLREPEFIRLRAADRRTELNGWLLRPPGFDPAREHPLLLYAYGGPGGQTVTDAWGGTRYLWHQLLARRGFIVASVDNRGTGARGREFRKQVYLRLGQLESEDQLVAARQLGERPSVDADRIGMWGWSYGGYLTLLTAARSGGAIAAAVAVGPVTHWKLYDTIYTERYMRTPGENPEGYRRGSPLEHAAELRSPLLVVHGTADDNVHPQNTLQLVGALEEETTQFRMRLYPNKRHGIGGARTRVNLFELITEFLEEELVGRRAEERAPQAPARR